MIIKKITTFLFFILLFGFVFSADYYISDLVVPKLAYEDENINIEIFVTNNSSSDKTIDLNVDFYAPTGSLIDSNSFTTPSIPANTTKKINHKIIVTDSNASASPHLIRAIVTDASDDNPSNNRMQKWIVVSKGQRKTPVPDMPIFFGVIAGFLILFFINKRK